MENSVFEHWGVLGTQAVAAITEVPARKVQLYVEQSLIKPSMRGTGRGNPRGFSLLDCLRVAIIRELELLGLSPRYIRQITARLRDSDLLMDGVVAPCVCVTSGDKGSVEITPGHEPEMIAKALKEFDEPERAEIRISTKALYEKVRLRANRHFG